MASTNVKRSSSGPQPARPGLHRYAKLRTYETIHHLNRGFELVLLNLERLRPLGFRREFLNQFHDMAQELRAETNHELMETLHQRELQDWTRYGRRNLRSEKRLRNPNDVRLEAKRIRQSPRAKAAHTATKYKRRRS